MPVILISISAYHSLTYSGFVCLVACSSMQGLELDFIVRTARSIAALAVSYISHSPENRPSLLPTEHALSLHMHSRSRDKKVTKFSSLLHTAPPLIAMNLLTANTQFHRNALLPTPLCDD